MATTARGAPYPVGGDNNDGPGAFLALANWTQDRPGIQVMTTAERNALAGGDLWRGRVISNDTTGAVEVYYGATTGWKPQWNVSWGTVGAALVTVDQTGITANADLTSFSVTFTAVANRIYEVRYTLGMTQATSTGSQQLNIVVDGASSVASARGPIAAGALETIAGISKQYTGLAAGSRIAKLQANTTAGTLTIPNAGQVNGRLTVMDVGPNGNAPAS